MKCLFIHNNFPAQFIHLANSLIQYGNEVVFLSNYRRNDVNIKGVRLILLPPVKIEQDKIKSDSHKTSQEMFFTGESFAGAMIKLKDEGFSPDIIIAHPGWGAAVYCKDIFPDAGYIAYCEWFYNKGELYHFFQRNDDKPSSYAPNRHRNFYQFDALSECDAAIAPTYWQHSQYPREFATKINIIHDGIDTNFFSPGQEDGKLGDIDLASFQEIVTYATRGMEPYRGFPQFYRAIPHILSARPNCHIVIMADDKTSYSAKRSDGKTWLQVMMDEVPEATSDRVHFIGYGNYLSYRKLLRFSSVHIYLSVPFVLSWSLLEAMSCGCLVVASATTPVREVIRNHFNGILTSFSDSKAIANDVINALDSTNGLSQIRINARKTIEEKYDTKITLPITLQLIETIVQRRSIAKKIFSSKDNK